MISNHQKNIILTKPNKMKNNLDCPIKSPCMYKAKQYTKEKTAIEVKNGYGLGSTK